MAADIDGNFTIEVEQGDTITIKFIGMQDKFLSNSLNEPPKAQNLSL